MSVVCPVCDGSFRSNATMTRFVHQFQATLALNPRLADVLTRMRAGEITALEAAEELAATRS